MIMMKLMRMDGFMYMSVTGNMDFTDIQKKYPLQDTIIGFYDSDQSFTVDNFEQVKNIDRWEYAPLDWGDSVMPFVRFNGEEYECWFFGYDRVCGYYYDGKQYGLVTFNSEFGTEITFPNKSDKYHIIMTPDEEDLKQYNNDWDEACQYENMIEHVARVFDPQAYKEGRIFTTYDGIKNFVYNREKSS